MGDELITCSKPL